jgi:hypothetical protein
MIPDLRIFMVKTICSFYKFIKYRNVVGLGK